MHPATAWSGRWPTAYSCTATRPPGRIPHLFARPAAFEALPGADIPVSAAIVDDAGHRIRTVDAPPIEAGGAPGDHQATIRSGSYATTVGYRTVDRLAALRIEPERPNPAPRSSIGLQARGFDALGNAVALEGIRWFVNGNSPGWNTSGASRLNVQVATTDLTLTASAGGVTATTQIRVGATSKRRRSSAPRALGLSPRRREAARVPQRELPASWRSRTISRRCAPRTPTPCSPRPCPANPRPLKWMCWETQAASACGPRS